MSEEVKLSKKEQYAANKKEKAAEKKEKRRVLASKISGGEEPSTDPFNYKVSFIRALNWYNLNADSKKCRLWVNEYLTNTNRKKLISNYNKISDYEFRSLGFLCRMKMRDQYLEQLEESFIENKLKELLDSTKQDQVVSDILENLEKKPKEVVNKLDKNHEDAIRFSEGFEEAIDNFVINKKSDFNAFDYLKANEVPAPVSKKIGEFYKEMLGELIEVQEGSDKQLAEGYSNFTKLQLKKFITFVESLVDACNQRVVSSKVRKPRVKKALPPEKIVAKLKFLKEFDDLNLKSVKPTSIVDSGEVWLYNTKNKRLIVYKAAKDSKLSIKGTAITGYDVKESVMVCLRKPDDFFKNTQLAKRALANGFKSIKTKPTAANGRINDSMIILGAF